MPGLTICLDILSVIYEDYFFKHIGHDADKKNNGDYEINWRSIENELNINDHLLVIANSEDYKIF